MTPLDYSQFVGTQKIEEIEHYYIGQKPNPIISVKAKDTVEDVLKILNDNGIFSVPVMDKKSEQTGNKEETPFIGLVSAMDLLTAFAFQPVFNTYHSENDISRLHEGTLKLVSEAQEKILKSPVVDCMGLTLEGKKLWSFSEQDSMSNLLDAFSVGVHRVLVSHGTQKEPFWSFVSQTDVLRYLKVQSYSPECRIHDVMLEPLSSLRLGLPDRDHPVFCVHEKASALSGFRGMIQRNEVSALPVVDTNGRLIETLSASDFRRINMDNMKDVLLTTGDFLKKHRGQLKQTLVVASPHEPLFSVVDKLLLTGVHRVWVVDANGKPIGVVSLTDIIKIFSSYGPTMEIRWRTEKLT